MFKGALHHLLCVDAALAKSTKAIWLPIISSIDQLSFLYLCIDDDVIFSIIMPIIYLFDIVRCAFLILHS